MVKQRLSLVALLVAIGFGLGLVCSVVLPRWAGLGAGPRVYNTTAILKQVETLSELVTVKYVMEKVEILEDPPQGLVAFVPGTTGRVILVAHGVVKAGVDLTQLKAPDIEVIGKKVVVRLPAARITDAYLDDKQTQVVEHTSGLLRTLNKDLEQTTRQNAIDDIRRAARSNGIVKDAEDRAREQLSRLLQNLGFTAVEFRAQ